MPDWVAPAAPAAAAQQVLAPQVAPPRRFQPARTNLGGFAKTGDARSLRRGLGHYSRTGLGGAATAASRMGGTARTAGGLYNVLESFSSGAATPAGISLNATTLSGRTPSEIADAITEALRPIDGTQDGESARDAMSRAFAELLEEDPTANLLDLGPAQIERVVEAYIANDLTNRVELDVGKAVLDKAPNAATGVARLEEMKAYVRQEIARAFRARAANGERLNNSNAATLTSNVLRDAFEVFESYL